MAVIKGYSSPTRGPVTADVLGFNGVTSLLVRDVGPSIFYLDPGAAPFTLLTSRMGTKTTNNPRFEWYEKSLRIKSSTLAAGDGDVDGSAANTSLGVTDDNAFQVGDLIFNASNSEIYWVTSQTDADTYVVVRGAAGSTAVDTAADLDVLLCIGSSFAEGVDVPPVDEWQESQVYNFTQIFRRSFGSSATREASEMLFGKPRAKLTGEKAIEHAMDIERAFLFSGREETQASGAATPAAGTGVARTTGGFRHFATSNVLDMAGASLSEPDLEGWLEDVFEHTAAGDSRTLFCSAPVITVLDMLAMDKIQTVSDPNLTYGIAVRQWRTSHGNLNIVKHRLLATLPDYLDGAIAVDLKKLSMRPLAGRSTKLLKNRQDNGVDGWVDEYITEVGLEIANPEVHGTLKNVGAAA